MTLKTGVMEKFSFAITIYFICFKLKIKVIDLFLNIVVLLYYLSKIFEKSYYF